MTRPSKPSFDSGSTGLHVEYLSYDSLTRNERAIFFPGLTVFPVDLAEGNGITDEMATQRAKANPVRDAVLPGHEHHIGYMPPSKEQP